jgi:hypothetical protein
MPDTLDALADCLDAEALPAPEPTEADRADADKETRPEVPEETAAGAEVSEVGHEVDPDTRRRLNALDHKRRQQLNRIAAEVEKHGKALVRIEEAEAAIEKAQQDLRNARTELAIRFEQRDAALRHKAEHEDKLREINDEIRELNMTSAERKARDARRAAEQRRAEEAAAELAAKEAFESELIPFEQHYVRVPKARRSEPEKWAIVPPHQRSIMVPRRDLPGLQAEHEEAVAAIARDKRDDLALELEAELRLNGKPTWFQTKVEEARWLTQWGPNSPRGKAYRERQNERGLLESDPVRLGAPLPGVYAVTEQPR